MKVKEMKLKRNMYAEDLWAHQYENIETTFLPAEEIFFVSNYADDQFEQMIELEA